MSAQKKDSNKPRYQQIKEQVVNRVMNGELQPGDRVPSEHELVKSAGVSRMTANRALRELNDEGYVNRIAGIGTFVADLKAESHLFEVRDIADEVRSRGHSHRAQVLLLAGEQATEEILQRLQLGSGASINHVQIIHFENEVPIQVEDRFVDPDFAPGFLQQQFTEATPSAYLNAIAPLQEVEHIVSAEMPSEQIRKHLKMAQAQPCLVVSRRTWVLGKPVSSARLYHPGNKFELVGHHVPAGFSKSTQTNWNTRS